MQRSTNKYPIIMEKNPGSPVAEAYRALRTSIEFVSAEQDLKLISITSAQQNEGKSTTAANLAIALAQAHKNVLLIDGDIRKPSQHEIFLKHNTIGLSNVLANQCSMQEAIEETRIDNLRLLTAGALPPNPSELLASSKLADLLEQAKHQYDMVVVDTPSVLMITDAQIIASKCDGVLLVVHAGKVKKQAVRRAKAVLDNMKANVLGVVLNHVKTKKRENEFGYYHVGYSGT